MAALRTRERGTDGDSSPNGGTVHGTLLDEGARPRGSPQRRELLVTGCAITVTVGGALLLAREDGLRLEQLASTRDWSGFGLQLGLVGAILFMVAGHLVYELARLGCLVRSTAHRSVPRQVLDSRLDRPAPALVIMIPSYKEEPSVVVKTLWSAALQEYPNRRIVLLIDDPPEPDEAVDRDRLVAMRQLPSHIRDLMDEPARRIEAAHRRLRRRSSDDIDLVAEVRQLAAMYDFVGNWLCTQADRYLVEDHSDAFFVDRVLREAGRQRLHCGGVLVQRVSAAMDLLSVGELIDHYERLLSAFRPRLASFERKRFANLSWAPNKAANLNSYIGLLGQDFRVIRDDRYLVPTSEPSTADLHIEDADYVMSLDADTVVVSDYATRLIEQMEREEHRRTAVMQTPYSAIPGASSTVETIAGATTDIQYLIHQGLTHYRATFWVGANAIMRRTALNDIQHAHTERGHVVKKFIPDRTAVEDSDATIDLVERGWRLHNYQERLAFSATPPDFGALLIQRRRWASGGMLIAPKLLRLLFRRPRLMRPLEAFMRFHYLLSLVGVSFGLSTLLIYLVLLFPFHSDVTSPWLAAASAPYFLLYARDLSAVGYRVADILRVYALNLVLVPINAGGALRSLQTWVTKAPVTFGRTPKVERRTAVPPMYLWLDYMIAAGLIIAGALHARSHHWVYGGFLLLTSGFVIYALVALIGVRTSFEDMGLDRVVSMLRSRVVRRAGLEPPVVGGSVSTTIER